MPAVAALYDIHGNLPALEAVLRDVRRASVSRVVVGGDVLPGPMPTECLAALARLEVPVDYICGNGDRTVIEHMDGKAPLTLPPSAQTIVRWTAEQLRPDHRRVICAWPSAVSIATDIGDVYFCHATPRSDMEIFTALTPSDAVARAFAGVGASIAVCGHTHMQFDRRVGLLRIVNAGSVGMPYGEPGAFWLLIGDRVDLRYTEYDLQAAADRLRKTSYPDVESFILNDMMEPKPESEMMKRFERYAIK